MSKNSLGAKIGRIPIATLKMPEGGVFAGRDIPKNRIDDLNWLRVLELSKPADNGPYIPREIFKHGNSRSKKDLKKKGILYRIALWMVEYEQGGKKPKSKSTTASVSSSSTSSKRASESQGKSESAPIEASNTMASIHKGGGWNVIDIPDWAKLSPETETSLLGLKQLREGGTLAIIGAGVSGLTLAWILNRARPDVKISVYDSKSQVGGWMRSHQPKIPDGYGSVTFESGPRTLLPSHPGSEVVARILHEIGVRDKLMGAVPKSSATNQKALVYNHAIQKLPSSGSSALSFLLRSPIMKGTKWQIIKDLFTRPRKSNVDDESVRSFISRRVGDRIADRMVSALMRGIYAADADKLSARSVARLNNLYYLERTEQMSILAAVFSGSLRYLDSYAREAIPLVFDALAPPSREGRQLLSKDNPVSEHSLYGFRSGIQGAADAIAEDLRKRKNVELHLSQGVESVSLRSRNEQAQNREKVSSKDRSDGLIIKMNDGSEAEADLLVSTVAKPEPFEKSSAKAAELMRQTKYSSLAVVNVWVPDERVAKDWFGILVPKTEDNWNKDGVIGVIFDSSVRNAMAQNQDASAKEKGSNMTVMIGGDLWSEMTVDEARDRALRGLESLLGPFDTSQAQTHVAMNRNCIPLFEVGYSMRKQQIHAEISHAYDNRVMLIGTAQGRGVGVSDCVVDAVMVALRFCEQRKLLYPNFFFNHWNVVTKPDEYA